MQVTASLRAVTQLSLAFPASPVLSHLTFKNLGPKSCGLYTLNGTQPFWFPKSNVIGISLFSPSPQCEFPGTKTVSLTYLCVLLPPSCRKLPSHSDLPNLSDAASSLHLVVVFVLPLFNSLSGLLTWMWMISSCKCGIGSAQGPPTPLSSQALHWWHKFCIFMFTSPPPTYDYFIGHMQFFLVDVTFEIVSILYSTHLNWCTFTMKQAETCKEETGCIHWQLSDL